jgi:quinoprotein glucose dehydrogenase
VRLVACVALRRLRDPRLTRLLDDADEQVTIEAARAIHDLPLSGAFAALAARAAAGPADDAFIRRAVSAAEQLGTADATTALLAVIARDGVSLEARQEAIDALRRWATPPRINRVTGEWLPSAVPRDVALARDALTKAVAGLAQPAATTLDESLRASLLTAASAVGVADITPTLRTWCGDATLSAASRAGALDALLAAGDGEVGPLADRLVGDREPLVRMAARRVRAAQQPTATIVPDLVAACGGPDLAERQQAVNLLAGISQPESTAAIAALAARLRDGSLDPTIALEVGEAAALRLGGKPDLAASPDPLASWQDVLAGGDPARGRGIFLGKEEVSCVRCHQAGGTGGDVGPKLDSIAKRCDPRSLLESIVLPNARVADGYATTVIITDEGLTISGVVTAEDAETVSLRNADGRIEKVAVTAIDERASGPSSMPADLAAKLSRRELRDLLAWLQSLK